MRHVAIYARISRDPAGRVEGVDRQERWGRAYAAERWPSAPVLVFSDNNLSGDRATHRPGLERLREAVRAGKVAHLWTVEQSRLARDELLWFELAAELLEAGIEEVHTDRDGIVRLDEVAGIKAVLAAAERRRLRRRVQDALDDLAAQGRPPAGKHVAYRRVRGPDGKNTIEPIPEVAEAVRWAAEAVLSGWSLSAVARELDRRGIPTAKGGQWATHNVRSMLTAPTVAGLRVRRGEVLRPGTWQPILDVDTWRQLCARLERRPRQPARRYLLSMIARCGRCGHGLTGRMQRRPRRPAVPYYFCHPTTGGCGRVGVMVERLDPLVVDRLIAELEQREAFRSAMAEDALAERRRELARALEAVDERQVELARRWAAGRLPAAAWDAAREELDRERARLADELDALPRPTARVTAEEIRTGWAHLTVEEQRHVLGLYVDHVVVEPRPRGGNRFDPTRVQIVWRTV